MARCALHDFNALCPGHAIKSCNARLAVDYFSLIFQVNRRCITHTLGKIQFFCFILFYFVYNRFVLMIICKDLL